MSGTDVGDANTTRKRMLEAEKEHSQNLKMRVQVDRCVSRDPSRDCCISNVQSVREDIVVSSTKAMFLDRRCISVFRVQNIRADMNHVSGSTT
eukprot:1657623-Rhodomonas_salina.3